MSRQGGGRRRGFTLVELMVVLTLLSVMVGTAAIALDGLSDAGRLRSTAGQIAACDALARTEAAVSGRPRRLRFNIGSNSCAMQTPRAVHGRWDWADDRVFRFGTSAVIDALTFADASSVRRSSHDAAVRFHDDGTSANYACVLRAGAARVTLVVDGITGGSRVIETPDRESLDPRRLFGDTMP